MEHKNALDLSTCGEQPLYRSYSVFMQQALRRNLMAMKKKIKDPKPGRQTSDPKPKWTIMIYLAGDNALSADCIAVMQALEAANPSREVEVLACFDSNTPRPKGSRYLQ